MSNIAAVLKGEIVRLARKELRAETGQLKQAVIRYRAEIAALKRENTELARRLSRLEKHAARMAGAATSSSEPALAIRFRADGLRKLRERLELSAPTLADILGVSAQTIYNWESKTTRPDKTMLARIAVLRKMGKREVQRRLAAMKSGK